MATIDFETQVEAAEADLDTNQRMLLEQKFAQKKKSMLVAYLLWGFLGGFGADQFYVDRVGWGISMLILWVAGWLTMGIVWIPFTIIWVINAFILKDKVREINNNTRLQIIENIKFLASKRK